jgi:Ca2+-binding RTX toxin-like protein
VVVVDPTADTTVEPDETVTFTLVANAAYTIGTTGAVTGTITNDDSSPVNIINGSGFVTGTARDDLINVTASPSNVSALDGNDIVNGNSGNDTLNGGNGNDTLNGNGGNDQLTGGNGDDLLDGGLGNDILNGGANADKFVIKLNEGTDTIQDFSIAQGDLFALGGGLTFGQLTFSNTFSGSQISSGVQVLSNVTGLSAVAINNPSLFVTI